MTTEHVDFQWVPPHVHHCNAVEWAICMFKNHFIAGLCSTNNQFPIHLWDSLLPQAELTLNLLCGSQLNPRLLAWAQLFGPFDFNCTPIVPWSMHHHPQKTQCAPQLGAPWHEWLVPWPGPELFLLLHHLGQ